MSTVFEEISVTGTEADYVYSVCTESLPNECIIRIFKVNNPHLITMYEQTKDIIRQRAGFEPEEMTVFHGCSKDSVENIVSNGFLTQFNRTSAYGIGTYVASKYSISRMYSINRHKKSSEEPYDFLLICKTSIGRKGIITGAVPINTNMFDCSCDNLSQPNQYTIPDNYGVLPLYAVEFFSGSSY